VNHRKYGDGARGNGCSIRRPFQPIVHGRGPVVVEAAAGLLSAVRSKPSLMSCGAKGEEEGLPSPRLSKGRREKTLGSDARFRLFAHRCRYSAVGCLGRLRASKRVKGRSGGANTSRDGAPEQNWLGMPSGRGGGVLAPGCGFRPPPLRGR